MSRLLGIAMLVGLAVVGAAGLASAQSYPIHAPTVAVSPSIVACGANITVTGTGWQAGSSVTISIASQPQVLGSALVAADGTFSRTFQTPNPLSVSQHTITANGTAADGTPGTASTTLAVNSCGAVKAPTSAGLAFTGSSNAGLLVAIGVALLLLGAVLTVAVTRRRKASISA